MKKTITAGLVIVLFFVLSGIAPAASVIKQLPYTKAVSLSTGTPYTLTFSLWTAETGGTQVWSENQALVLVTQVINTFLGKTTTLSGVDFSQQLWVEVTQGGSPVGSRDALPVSPYALWSYVGTDSTKVAKTGDTMSGTLNLPANGLTVGTNQLVVSGGNVGIGTAAAPAQKLEVNGTVKATGFQGNGSGLTNVTGVDSTKVAKSGDAMTGALNLPANGLAVGTNQLVVSGGNVGIGTTPGAKLDVNGNLKINGPLSFPNSAGGMVSLTSRTFDNEASFESNNVKLILGSVGLKTVLSAFPPPYQFMIGHNSWRFTKPVAGFPKPQLSSVDNFVSVFSVNEQGNVKAAGSISGGETTSGWVLGKGGWGPDNWLRLTTTEGGSTYHDLAVNQFWAAGAKRYDLAEVTPAKSEDKLEQGDVVVIDPEQGLRVARSTRANDTAVYGIVSSYEQASFVIGGEGPETAKGATDKLPVALIGRVKAKVSAEAGPIRPGDRLITSATPGHLMRCGDLSKCTGAIAGKALESLDSGRGVITVLVTLQ